MKYLILVGLLITTALLPAQDKTDTEIIRSFYDEALSSREAYENLEWLCKNTAGRICGTPEAAAAVEETAETVEQVAPEAAPAAE